MRTVSGDLWLFTRVTDEQGRLAFFTGSASPSQFRLLFSQLPGNLQPFPDFNANPRSLGILF